MPDVQDDKAGARTTETYVEDSGHKWRAGDGSRFDPALGVVVYQGYVATGDERCEYCQLPYREYSAWCQRGDVRCCPSQIRIVDGVTITGPKT